MIGYILQRKLRHIQSIGLYDVSIPLTKHKSNIQDDWIRPKSCFFNIETVTNGEHEVIYISEIQPNILRSVQFNEMRFPGDPLTCFKLNIFVEITRDPTKDKDQRDDPSWVKITSYSINLNHLRVIDPEFMNPHVINLPIFKMNDGYFTINNDINQNNNHSLYWKNENHQMVHPHRMKYSTTHIKQSINYNNLIKLNKLIGYQKQLSRQKSKLSMEIENNLSSNEFQLDITKEDRIRIVQEYIHDTENRISTKKSELEMLQKDLNITEISNRQEPDSNILIDQDEYGDIYSNLIQVKDRIGRLKRRKMLKLLNIFDNIISQVQTMKFFDFNIEDMNSVDDDNEYILTKDFKFETLSYKHLIQLLNESEDTKLKINTNLGNYVLLLKLVTEKIINIQIPYQLSYYGSTSIINSHYPLYLLDNQSTLQLEKFEKAIQLLNTNINQINQFLQV